MRRRYEMESFLDPTPQLHDSPTFGGAGTDPKTVLSSRLQGLTRQRDQIQKRSALLNTSPLGGTSAQDGQDMVDLSQTIAALGQKIANPTKGIQFAPEPRVSTTPNARQAGWAHERAVDGAVDARNTAGVNRRLAALSRQGGY